MSKAHQVTVCFSPEKTVLILVPGIIQFNLVQIHPKVPREGSARLDDILCTLPSHTSFLHVSARALSHADCHFRVAWTRPPFRYKAASL